MHISIVSCFNGNGKHVVGLLARFLKKYFEKLNIECSCVDWRTLFSQDDWSKYEHLLSVDKVGFTKQAENNEIKEKINILRKQNKGELCAIEHIVQNKDRFVEDRIFVTLSHSDIVIPNTKISYIGWAAEPEYCFPESKEFIFIDHPYYNQRRGWSDYSYIFKNCCSELNKTKTLFLDNDGILEVAHNQYTQVLFDRSKNISWEVIVPYYRKAKVFIVTHKERLGWSVIEAAMSGAVILMPKGAIHSSLITDVPHVIVDNMNDKEEVKIKISEALDLSDKMKAEGYKERDNLTHTYTWEKMCSRIITALVS